MLNASKVLDKLELDGDEKVGVDIVRRALVAPIKQIAENSGLDGSIVANAAIVPAGDNGAVSVYVTVAAPLVTVPPKFVMVTEYRPESDKQVPVSTRLLAVAPAIGDPSRSH
mgnify:CR=1 FL=1